MIFFRLSEKAGVFIAITCEQVIRANFVKGHYISKVTAIAKQMMRCNFWRGDWQASKRLQRNNIM